MNLHSLRVRTAICGTALAVTAGVVAVAPEVATAAQGSASTYVLLYKDGSSSSDAQSTVSAAGGSVVANYAKIGVVIARSASASFASDVQMNRKVSAAARTDGFATSIGKDQAAGADAAAAAATCGRQPFRSAVGHAADQRACGARGHRRRSLRRGRRYRHRPGLHPP